MKTIILDGTEYELVPVTKEGVFNDWRLPTIQELKTLVNYNKWNPASDLEDIESEYYWSSSTVISGSNSNHAWTVYFGNGGDSWGGKSSPSLVRCVRDGINGLEWSSSSEDKMAWKEAFEYADSLVAPVYYKE